MLTISYIWVPFTPSPPPSFHYFIIVIKIDSGQTNHCLCEKQLLETYTADFFCDRVGALVSTTEHHLVDHDLFSAEDDSIRADDSTSCAINKKERGKMLGP